MKKVLIISPSFPPVNAADMQRVRMSLPYFEKNGWTPIVLCVDPKKNERSLDPLLLQSLPANLAIYASSAFSVNWTRKIGLGSLALRSLFFLFWTGMKIIRSEKPDLILFSTTDFPVMILGRVWKFLTGKPYILDIQDMWFSTYYESKPKNERPKKYWFSYHLNKFTEPYAMKKTSGIMAVSLGYITILQDRYSNLNNDNSLVLPFGGFDKDFEIARTLPNTRAHKDQILIRYVGRGGHDMKYALSLIFIAFKKGLAENPELFQKVRFEFWGTSYAPNGKGLPTVFPIAEELGLGQYVSEKTDRVPYFQALKFLLDADLLFIPGSNDPNYTASKLFPYILSKNPICAIFNENSSVVSILQDINAGIVVKYTSNSSENNDFNAEETFNQLQSILEKLPFTPSTDWTKFNKYSAERMTEKMIHLFNTCLKYA